MSARVLVVEDEKAIQLALRGLLRRDGYDVDLADTGEDALRKLGEKPYDLVLTDLALGRGISGMDVLRASKEARAETAVVMITAHGNEKVAVEAMKQGAEDYVPKPFDNEELRVVVRRALERTQLQREHRMLLERVERETSFENLIGQGRAMKQIFEIVQKVAETDLSVLVRGESGTGKELVAQALHQRSARRAKPFVAVNCAAISKELVESELFGHEKGAFTGADARRVGKFEAANGGTIFLDEIGDMAPETQAKVLRVLQEKSFEPVGGNRVVQVDVRVVAATHRDLEAEVESGRFREDLYYRLKVVEMTLPPLRERLEDVPLLVEKFVHQVAERLGREPKHASNEALTRLMRHPWRGNVRELRNTIERAAVLASKAEIEPEDLALDGEPLPVNHTNAGLPPGVPFRDAKRITVESFERAYLVKALREHGGNVSRTAEAIGMVRQSLQQKIRELDLRSEDWSEDS
jgi:two-component system response regulator AtoC/two-component system nitrogen regulation response regulator NtrX